MPLTTQSFDQIVSQQATAIQGQQPQLSNFNPGSILRAVIEAVAGVVMYLQNLIVAMYAIARASTSTGADLDSWMADFSFTRLAATFATGQVTFARFTPTNQATIPVGTQVETGDGTLVYNVIADTTNVNYNAGLNAYVIPANTSSASVTVEAVAAGSAYNAIAAAINTLVSPVVGVDTVTNVSAFTNGLDAESDAAFRTRFQGFIQTRGEGTTAAIGQAIVDLQDNLTYSLTENLDYNGATDYGYFYVVVDDGSGNPPSQLLNNIQVAINQVRACGIRFGVFGPSVLNAIISMTITSAAGYTHSQVVAAVVTAITNYVNSLGVGVTLPYLQLAAVAFEVPGVINVAALSLNSGTSDLIPTAKQVIKTSSVTVT